MGASRNQAALSQVPDLRACACSCISCILTGRKCVVAGAKKRQKPPARARDHCRRERHHGHFASGADPADGPEQANATFSPPAAHSDCTSAAHSRRSSGNGASEEPPSILLVRRGQGGDSCVFVKFQQPSTQVAVAITPRTRVRLPQRRHRHEHRQDQAAGEVRGAWTVNCGVPAGNRETGHASGGRAAAQERDRKGGSQAAQTGPTSTRGFLRCLGPCAL